MGKGATYEDQREALVPCSSELKEVLCSESPKNSEKVKTKHLVLEGWWYRNEVEQALKNVIPTSERVPLFGVKMMYVSPGMGSYDFRFRLYKHGHVEEKVSEEIPLWDLEIRFVEPHPENVQQAISIMIPRFQKVIE